MTSYSRLYRTKTLCAVAFWAFALISSACAAPITVELRPHNPYGSPRPGNGHQNVPLRTSYFIQLSVPAPDTVLSNTVTVKLKPSNPQPEFFILKSDLGFQPGYSGTFRATSGDNRNVLSIYADSEVSLDPLTTYTITVGAASANGGTLPQDPASSKTVKNPWAFTTEPSPSTDTLTLALDATSATLKWDGGFFTGFCKPSFCTTLLYNRIPGYDLMDQARQTAPKAWSVQRDWWVTGFEHDGTGILPGGQPNAVRERETRRISAMDTGTSETILHVEDFFGHEQYGIESSRTLSLDYSPGDVVLIADGVSDARTTVTAVDDDNWTVTVKAFPAPSVAWRINYLGALPTKENPDAPGLFPPGGCYLRKFSPSGTPCYYWGRIDKEEDIVHRTYGRRLHVNFADAPGDLAIDGRAWTTAKDLVQLHKVTYDITTHFIDRYGSASLTFVWSIFNEPDLAGAFWRTNDWNELQRFYDYSVDGILRAFEDKGYDSNKVFIGGLELGIFLNNLKIFLAHCSPTATMAGALPKNAAYADPRLDGKRSQRVETLCAANNGKGTPLDFISLHSYKSASNMALTQKTGKDYALQVDPVYYRNLWINSHESCPDWSLPPDTAADDSYLGNDYYSTWCADVVRRQLQQAKVDARYGMGETILTFWPFVSKNFSNAADVTQVLSVDDDGDWKEDRELPIPFPVFHVLNFLSNMGDRYWVFPEKKVGGQTVSGFASRTTETLSVLLYSHQEIDTQSRANRAFDITLDVSNLGWSKAYAEQYQIDRTSNSTFDLALEWRKRGDKVMLNPQEAAEAEDMARLKVTKSLALTESNGKITIPARVLGNGVNFIKITPNVANAKDWAWFE